MTGFYDVVHRRRAIRGEFTGAPVPTEVLHRILGAAHAAPSAPLTGATTPTARQRPDRGW